LIVCGTMRKLAGPSKESKYEGVAHGGRTVIFAGIRPRRRSMMRTSNPSDGKYRIWITAPAAWQPLHWHDRPSQARVVALATEGLFTAEQAAAYLEGFNTQLLHEPKRVWGIAVRVDVECHGDLRPGQAWRPARARRPNRRMGTGRQLGRRNVGRPARGVGPSRANHVARRKRTQGLG
jgi:hypothetical protein